MHCHHVLAAVIFAAFVGSRAAIPAAAGPADVKAPEIEKGETEFATNNAFQFGYPANADRVRHSYDLTAGYAFTSHFKAGLKAGFDTPVGDNSRLSIAGVETQFYLGKIAPSISWGWYTSLDARVDRDETNALLFGPLIKFGDDKLALTLNPLFERTFGANSDSGLAFAYAVGLKGEVREGFAVGIEAGGSIPDISSAPGVSFQAHRIGPVLYFDREVASAREGRGAKKLSLEIGGYVGLTDATPDWTGRVKAALTW
jgi:hypothetical protein